MKDKKRKEKKRQRGRSVQELMGIYGFKSEAKRS